MPPTDPSINFAGKQPTPELIAEVKTQFGLDKPLYQQYGLFVKRIFLGDQYGWPGLRLLVQHAVGAEADPVGPDDHHHSLAIGASLSWLCLGIPIGILSALKPRSVSDRLAMGFALFGVSAPVFWPGRSCSSGCSGSSWASPPGPATCPSPRASSRG